MSAIPLHTLPPQHYPANSATPAAPATAGSAYPSALGQQPVLTNSSPAPPPTTASLPPSSLPLPNGTTNSTPKPPTHSFLRTSSSLFTYFLKPLFALLIYALTLYTAWSATQRHTLLGSVSPALGTWFLVMLAKAGDIVFGFAIADAFDILAWRKLKQRRRTAGPDKFGGIRFDWFLSMVSSTGVEGLARLIWWRLWGRLKEIVGSVWRKVGGRAGHSGGSALGMNVRQSWKRRLRERWKKGAFARWSYVRLLFILALIPGPGIILTADIEQKDVFFDARTMTVSGGLATYDPTIATAYQRVLGAEVSKLFQTMLRDRSVSWPVDPISPACKAGNNCTSYLLAGQYVTVAPWPFTRETEDMDGFRMYNAPFYQVDLWDPEPGLLTFSQHLDCTLYGGFDAADQFSMSVCIAAIAGQEYEGVLAAGWESCGQGYDPQNLTCLGGANREDWVAYLRFYRRHATIVFSRTEFTIQEVTDLSIPELQTITAPSLFQSLNTILYRPNQTSNDARYDRTSQRYLLTQNIGSFLWQSLKDRANGLTIGRDWLRNIVTMPVYLFQETALTLDPDVPLDGTRTQPNLPAENYVTGSYCIHDKRAIPGPGTVYAYTAVAGVLLIWMLVAKVGAARGEQIETSEYPLVDYEALTVLVDERDEEVELTDRFDLQRKKYGNGRVLSEIADLRIGLRRP